MDWETYLLMASVLFLLVGQILIAVQAVRVEAIWGFVVFIVPFAAPVFVMLHWRETKVPFFFWLARFRINGGQRIWSRGLCGSTSHPRRSGGSIHGPGVQTNRHRALRPEE